MRSLMNEVPTTAPREFSEYPKLLLPGPAGVLEAATALPAPADARRGTAIICHPHSQQGGTMHNKVVTIIERSLRELGLATVTFNFRSVGASTGTFDDGNGETDDVLAIAAWVQEVRSDADLWLAGFSFGSYVAARAAAQLPLRQLISIAPPVNRWDFAGVAPPACPWLIVQGEADEIVDPAAVYAFVEAQQKPPTLVRMPDTSHFFHRRLMDLRGVIKNGVRANLPPPVGDAA
jgi:alpha/beta superfamily hydrolase